MNYIDLGKRIREERQTLSLTQEKLAETINVSTTYIGQIERGERCPTLETLLKISNALAVTIDYLLQESIEESHTASTKLWIQLTADLNEDEKAMVLELVRVVKNHRK